MFVGFLGMMGTSNLEIARGIDFPQFHFVAGPGYRVKATEMIVPPF